MTPGERQMAEAAIFRSARILETYWAHHGKPEALVDQHNQALRLVLDLYPPGYPLGMADDSPEKEITS